MDKYTQTMLDQYRNGVLPAHRTSALAAKLVIELDRLEAAALQHQRDAEGLAESHNALVRELDVLLNGEAGAAEQASLCDIVGQVRKAGVVAGEDKGVSMRLRRVVKLLDMESAVPAGDLSGVAFSVLGMIAAKIASGHALNGKRDPRDVPLVRGWACFHCGEVFTTPGAARDHFGFEPSADPACRIKLGGERGLIQALRKAEQDAAGAWARVHEEAGDAVRAYMAAAVRHGEALRSAEEAGYQRGLADGYKEANCGFMHP